MGQRCTVNCKVGIANTSEMEVQCLKRGVWMMGLNQVFSADDIPACIERKCGEVYFKTALQFNLNENCENAESGSECVASCKIGIVVGTQTAEKRLRCYDGKWFDGDLSLDCNSNYGPECRRQKCFTGDLNITGPSILAGKCSEESIFDSETCSLHCIVNDWMKLDSKRRELSCDGETWKHKLPRETNAREMSTIVCLGYRLVKSLIFHRTGPGRGDMD